MHLEYCPKQRCITRDPHKGSHDSAPTISILKSLRHGYGTSKNPQLHYDLEMMRDQNLF